MKVGFNVAPLLSGHKARGIGYYASHLLQELEKDPSIEVIKFTKAGGLKDLDVVHYPWFDLFFHTLPLFKKFPAVVTIHDVIPLIFPKQHPVGIKGKINYQLQQLALRKCKYIITDSQSSRKDIIDLLRINEEKIVVIPLAIDKKFKVLPDAALLRIKKKYSLPQKFILYVGDANYVKNLPFLIEGFYRLTRLPEFSDLKLVLVNSVFLKKVENIDHPELESLKKVNKAIKEYNIDNLVIKPGFIDDEDLVGFFNLASVYVQPSLYEGFGLPILQSFACQTPVLSSNAGSLSEVGSNAAIYFNPTRMDEFLIKIKLLLLDKTLQKKLTKIGILQAARFSWNKVSNQTIEVYKLSLK